jgi:hypothetical protein
MLGAVAFFWVMAGQMPQSTDPSGMMRDVGEVAGLIGTIGLALLVAGLLGWQGLAKKPNGE